jgi:hypothetical protein
MKDRGWDHDAMTAKQRELFDQLASSGKPNTLSAHSEIARKALIAGGASTSEAVALVEKSVQNLKTQNVSNPTRIPWN